MNFAVLKKGKNQVPDNKLFCISVHFLSVGSESCWVGPLGVQSLQLLSLTQRQSKLPTQFAGLQNHFFTDALKTAYSSQLKLYWILSCGSDESSGFHSSLLHPLWRGTWSHVPTFDHRCHFLQIQNQGISTHELFLLAFRLWCSKAYFWEMSPK